MFVFYIESTDFERKDTSFDLFPDDDGWPDVFLFVFFGEDSFGD